MSDKQLKCRQSKAGCANPMACPLNEVREGTDVRILQLSAPPAVNHRLREMGMGEEKQVRLLAQNSSIICQVCNMRVGLSSSLGDKILVEPVHKRAA